MEDRKWAYVRVTEANGDAERREVTPHGKYMGVRAVAKRHTHQWIVLDPERI